MLRTAVLALTFFTVGFADAARGLTSLPTGSVHVPGAALEALPWVGMAAALLLALPAGVLAAKTGKKSTVLLGLCIAMVGNLVPVLAASRAGDLLLATFLVGAGFTCVQVAGLPMVWDAIGTRAAARVLVICCAATRAGIALAPRAATALSAQGWRWTVLFAAFTILVVAAFSLMVVCRVEERLEREGPIGAVFAETARAAVRPRTLLLLLAAGVCATMQAGMEPALSGATALGISPHHLEAAIIASMLLGALALSWISPRSLLLFAAVTAAVAAMALLAFRDGWFLVATVASGAAFGTALPVVLVLLLESQPGRATLAAGLALAVVALGGATSLLPASAIHNRLAVTMSDLHGVLPLWLPVLLTALLLAAVVVLPARSRSAAQVAEPPQDG